jgi:hypothetical protein
MVIFSLSFSNSFSSNSNSFPLNLKISEQQRSGSRGVLRKLEAENSACGQEETRKIVFRGERGPRPPFLDHDFFNRPEKGAGEFEPPQVFGPATKTYYQFAAIHCNLLQFAAICRNLLQFAAICCNSLQFAAIDR